MTEQKQNFSKNTVPSDKNGDKSMMLWGCFSSSSTENLEKVGKKNGI